MRFLSILTVSSVLLGGVASLRADAIPYPNVGVVAPTVTLYAESTSITAIFDSASAGDMDTISLFDITGGFGSAPFFNNLTTPGGTSITLTGTKPGDQIVFLLNNAYLGASFASLPSYSSDGVNHAYVTPYSGGTILKDLVGPGLYIGMEDLPASGTDFDYNDLTFIVQDVSTSPVPEPSTLLMAGTGLAGLAGAIRRRFKS